MGACIPIFLHVINPELARRETFYRPRERCTLYQVQLGLAVLIGAQGHAGINSVDTVFSEEQGNGGGG
jgi:hypothetical protein